MDNKIAIIVFNHVVLFCEITSSLARIVGDLQTCELRGVFRLKNLFKFILGIIQFRAEYRGLWRLPE